MWFGNIEYMSPQRGECCHFVVFLVGKWIVKTHFWLPYDCTSVLNAVFWAAPMFERPKGHLKEVMWPNAAVKVSVKNPPVRQYWLPRPLPRLPAPSHSIITEGLTSILRAINYLPKFYFCKSKTSLLQCR